MENYEKFEQLLQHFSYSELSIRDKEIVDFFVKSEEEYESLRHAHQQLNSLAEKKSEPSLDPKVWKKVKTTLAHRSDSNQKFAWLKTPMPAYVTFLLLLTVGSLGWYGGTSYKPSQTIVEQIKPKVDTVFIASKPDTVIKERVIYITRDTKPIVVQASVESLPNYTVPRGVTMKEKEELEKLLVSGSM